MEPLVKGLVTQQMGRGTGGGCGTFALTPHDHHVVIPGEDYVFAHMNFFPILLWCRILPAIYNSEFVVPQMGLDQLTKSATT